MESSIRKNYIYNTLYQILVVITPLITAPYISRIFEADGIGIQSYSSSVVSYFILFATLGTAAYGQREIAKRKENKTEYSKIFWEIEIISIVSTLISLLVWVIFILVSRNEYRPYFWVHTISVIAVAFDITWLFAGLEKFKEIAIRNIIIRISGIICLFLFVKTKDDIALYIAIWALVNLIGGISLWILIPREITKIKYCDLSIRQHIKKIWLFFIPTIATSVYTILDKTMIVVITNNLFFNGYYEQAEKIVKMSQSVLLSLNTVMYSRMSLLFADNKLEELKNKLEKSIDFMMFLAVPMAFGISGISFGFVGWFFGKGYDQVIPLMIFFSPLLIIIGISNSLSYQYLTPSNQQMKVNKAIIVGAISNFLINIVLIPILGCVGAAIATVIAELIISLIIYRYSKNFINGNKILISIIRRLPSSCIMFAVIYLLYGKLNISIVSTLIEICMGTVIYFACSLLLKDSALIQIVNLARRTSK